jgi:hypothetical protein
MIHSHTARPSTVITLWDFSFVSVRVCSATTGLIFPHVGHCVTSKLGEILELFDREVIDIVYVVTGDFTEKAVDLVLFTKIF